MVAFKIMEMYVYRNTKSDYYQLLRTFFSLKLNSKVYICWSMLFAPKMHIL